MNSPDGLVDLGLRRGEWIERLFIVDHPATVESGELTPTLKVRRHFVEEKYAEVIEEMYASTGGTK